MPRYINFTSGPECAQSNPYFKVQTFIPTRYLYEYLEELVIDELGIIPKRGKGYNFSFQDFPQLADLFNVVGIVGDITLTFAEDFVILEVFSTNTVRYANSYCAEYVERVEADGGEVVDPSGVCAALSYLQPTGVVFNRLNYSDLLSVSDNFLVNKGRGWNQSLVDVLSLNEIINVTKTKGTSISTTDQLSIADLFVYQLVSNGNLNFLEGLIAAEVFNAFTTNGYTLSFNDGLNLAEGFLQSTNKGSKLSFIDRADISELFLTQSVKGLMMSFTDGMGVTDQFVQTVLRGRKFNLMDRVDLSDLFSAQSDIGWTFSFSDAVNAADAYTIVGQATGSTLSYMEMLLLAEQFNHQTTKGTKLTYSDVVTVSEVYGSYIQRYDGSACNVYVDRVEADGGEVVDVTATCQVFSYFSTRATSGYVYSLTDSMSLSDVFQLVGTSRQRNQSFVDSLAVADSFTPFVEYKNKLFLQDSLSVTDLFNVYRRVNILLSLNDSVTVVDTQDRQVTFVGKYNLSLLDTLEVTDSFDTSRTQNTTLTFLDLLTLTDAAGSNKSTTKQQFFVDSVSVDDQFTSSGIDNTNLSFLDFVSALDQTGLARTATRNLIFNDSFALGEQEAEYVQRYSGSACEVYVDRVEADGGEVIDVLGVCQAFAHFNTSPTTGYKYSFTESLSILTFESIVSGAKRNYNFAFLDSLNTQEEYVIRRSRNIFLNFTEELNLAASN